METKDTIYVSWRRLRCLTELSKHATENKLINTNMEFEDYEDMFTFEEWSFQHPPSDGNDAKTFDELCEEVLRLSYACDKEDSVVHESPSNVSEVSSKKYEEPKVEHVHTVELLITSDTSLTSHLKPGRDCHFQQDFVASGAQTINDFILSAEKHKTCPQYSSEKSNVPTAMISAEGREAQRLECKLVSKNSEECPTQVAMNMTNVKESSLDPNLYPSYNASSEDENTLQSSTDTLQNAPKQTPSKNVVSREETEVLISIDTNGENTQPGNCRSKKHVSVASQILSNAQNVCSGITTSFLANIHIENESSKEAVNSCGVLDDEYGSKSQNTMLEFQIKVDVNREIKSVSESKENEYDITLGPADSQNTQLKSTSVKENLSSNLVSEQATSLSPINYSSQTSEIAKVDCATDAARNGINDAEASEEKFSSLETYQASPSSETPLLTSFPPNQKIDEERNDEITTKSNADNASNIITCGSETAEVLSPKVSKLNYEESGSEVYPNSDINVDTSMNFKTDKNQTFDSIFNINDVDVNTEISFCQKESLENKLKESVQSVELSKNQQESENRVIQDARTVKSKLVLRRTRNETSNLDGEQIFKISNESPQNYFESKKRRFKLRPPVAQQRIKTYSNKKRAEKLLQSTCEKKAAYISSDKHTTSTTNDSEKEVITLSKSASIGSQVMDKEDLKSITLDIQGPESKFESLIEIITPPENWKMTDDSKTFSTNFSVSPTKESLTNAGKEEVILPTLNSKEHETVITKSQPEVQKNNRSNEVIYLRTTDTISVIDKTNASSTPFTSEKNNNCEQTSTATIEINTNKQFSKGTLRTVINVKHNSISPDGESTCIIHQSDTSGEEKKMASRTRGAARIVPFSRYVGSPLALGPYRSTLRESCTIGTALTTNVRSLEKESDFHSYQRNFANDSNDEVIVTESNEQPGRVLQPKAYERKIIRYDYITPKIVNRDPRSRKRAADHLTPEVNETSSQVSLDNKSEGTIKEIISTSNKDPIMSLPKKSRLVSSEKSLIVDGNSGNDSIQSKMDIGKIDPLLIDSQNEIQNSKNLENTSKKQLEKPSMPSILLTQEDENLEEGTTRIIHRVENQSNLTSRKIYKVDHFQGENTSNMSESFCHNPFSDSSSNIFNDETIKAICASEKAETSIRSPAQYSESGKSFVAEPTKNLRHPSRNSRGGIIRRSFDSGSEPSSSTRKSRVDILRSQAKFLKSCPHRSSSPNVKPESEEKTCIKTDLISSHPRSDSQVKQKPSTEGSKTSEGDPPASEPPRTSSSTESGIGACPVHFGNASTTRTVRRLRRTSAPLPFPHFSPAQGATSTSGRVLRRRVLPPTQPPAPTPPTA